MKYKLFTKLTIIHIEDAVSAWLETDPSISIISQQLVPDGVKVASLSVFYTDAGVSPAKATKTAIDEPTRALLKKHGFKWYKDKSTDTVEASHIEDILPAANGFTVVYRQGGGIVLDYSTATVKLIEIPESINDDYILVHWVNIEDQRLEARAGTKVPR